jgi:hypothetical protein
MSKSLLPLLMSSMSHMLSHNQILVMESDMVVIGVREQMTNPCSLCSPHHKVQTPQYMIPTNSALFLA